MAIERSNEWFSEFDPALAINDSVANSAADWILESYLKYLEQGGADSPEKFLNASKDDPRLTGVDRETLLQSLASVKLVHDAGQKIHSSVAGSANLPHPGMRLGDYQILRTLARGGMGIVFLAKQLSLNRLVALKVLAVAGLDDAQAKSRFQLEARAAASLLHPNIVPVYGVGQHGSWHYYVMQLIPGLGLDCVLKELKRSRRQKSGTNRTGSTSNEDSDEGNSIGAGRTKRLNDSTEAWETNSEKIVGTDSGQGFFLSSSSQQDTDGSSDVLTEVSDEAANSSSSFRLPGQRDLGPAVDSNHSYWHSIARIGTQVSHALTYAHSQGVVHRDIKPSNLLLDSDGTVWVTDFGLAKSRGTDNLTRTGDIVGTLRYMAPERMRGISDERGDIYSLGITLYELATFRAAFSDVDREVLLKQVLHTEPPPPRSIEPKMPRDLETIILKAIAKTRDDRYLSANDLALDLERFLSDRPIHARRLLVHEVVGRWCRRNPVVATMTGVLLLTVVSLATMLIIANFVRNQRDLALANLNRAELAESAAKQNQVRAEAAEREVRWRNHLAQAGLIRRKKGIGQRTNSIAEVDKALAIIEHHTPESRRELGNELIADLALTDLTPASEWECSLNKRLGIDSEFQTYSVCSELGPISVRRLSDNSEIQQLVHPRGVGFDRMVFSPDGEFLAAIADQREVLVWRLKDGKLIFEIADCRFEFCFDFMPDDRIIVGTGNEFVIGNLGSGEIVSRIPAKAKPYFVACSPDGSQIVTWFSPDDRNCQIISTSTGELLAESRFLANLQFATWHPQRPEIAIALFNGSIHTTDTEHPGRTREFARGLANGLGLSFSPDGSILASTDWSRNFRLWDYASANVLVEETIGVHPICFRNDGKQIGILQDGKTARTMAILESDVYQKLSRTDAYGADKSFVLHGDFHPAGQWLVLGTNNGVDVVRTSDGQLIDSVKGDYADHYTIDFRFERSNALEVMNPSGLYRWPIHTDESGQRQLGPPVPILKRPARLSYNRFDRPADSSFLVVADYYGGLLFRNDDFEAPIKLRPHADCRFAAASPDGLWVATASHFGAEEIKVWSATNGQFVASLLMDDSSELSFSPDSQWLTTAGGGCRLWHVGSWNQGPEIGGLAGDFSPDSRLLVNHRQGALRLFDLQQQREIAQLVDPFNDRSLQHVFSPDGEKLLVVNAGAMWDLRRIRELLSERELDWDLPNLVGPFRQVADESVQPIRVKIIEADSQQLTPEQQAAIEFEQAKKELTTAPENAFAQNNLAWMLVTGPPERWDAKQALDLAEKAFAQKPEDDLYANTLGVALYRAGRFQDAVDRLTPNVARSGDEGMAFDLYFIAMAWHQLGKEQLSANYLTWANKWVESMRAAGRLPANYLQELVEIRAEAERVCHSE